MAAMLRLPCHCEGRKARGNLPGQGGSIFQTPMNGEAYCRRLPGGELPRRGKRGHPGVRRAFALLAMTRNEERLIGHSEGA